MATISNLFRTASSAVWAGGVAAGPVGQVINGIRFALSGAFHGAAIVTGLFVRK